MSVRRTLGFPAWRRLPATGWVILSLSTLVALVSAFNVPVMSYFIIDGLKVPPYYVGLYTICTALASVLFSQLLGACTDRGWPIKWALLLALAGTAGGTLIFAVTDSFWLVLVAGMSLMALGNAAMPQILALGRRFADAEEMDPGGFNALIRSQFSMSWIVGPPLAFALVAHWGFGATFGAAAFVALVCAAVGYRGLPPVAKNAVSTASDHRAPVPKAFWAYSLALFGVAMSNALYLTSMPLYVLKELALPDATPGWAMAVAAGLEIPVMLIASRLAGRFGTRPLLQIGAVAGVVFYLGMYVASGALAVVLLQAVNGLFFGLFAGLGISLIQDLLPGRLGFASAFYTNAMRIGSMIGSTLMGIVATWLSYQNVLLWAAACTVMTGAALWIAGRWEQPVQG